MTYRVEPLGDHELSQFTCGNVELDDWLHRHARTATGQDTRTSVLVDHARPGHGLLRRDAAPLATRRRTVASRSWGASADPGDPVGQAGPPLRGPGQALGAALLVHALETIVEAARRAGGRVVLVDVIDDNAYAFYEHHDFQPLPDQPRRLVMKLSTAAKALGMPWP